VAAVDERVPAFAVEPERMFEFYGGVLGFKQLTTFSVGNGGVARFQAGAQELKLTKQVGNRVYHAGVSKRHRAAPGFVFLRRRGGARQTLRRTRPSGSEFAPLGDKADAPRWCSTPTASRSSS